MGRSRLIDRSLPRDRRYRHARVPSPAPPPGRASWLRGRRASPPCLLALHHAAVLIGFGWWKGDQLTAASFVACPAHQWWMWRPCAATFMRWLLHHRIARRIGPNLYTTDPDAREFADLPNRCRVQRIGELILRREAAGSLAIRGAPHAHGRPEGSFDLTAPRGRKAFYEHSKLYHDLGVRLDLRPARGSDPGECQKRT